MMKSSPPALFEFDASDDIWLARVRNAITPVEHAGETNPGPLASGVDSDLAGSRVGPYELVRRIGAGGMGTVWLARRADGHFDQTVAIKLIKRGMDTDEIIRRFHRERQVLATLTHANIARLLDGGGAQDGRPYLAMEYVEGRTLLEYAEEHRLSVEERLKIFRDVCLAVQHAHANLVLHRDLKPTNILVTIEGAAKLLDFGIAKLLDDELAPTALTRSDARALTPRYASPEQIRGEHLTTATDIYSLGVVLYELLSGTDPYQCERGTRREFERIILERDPIPPSVAVRTRVDLPDNACLSLSRRLRGDLDAIVLKALARNPNERYASAEQLAEDLQRHMDGLPLLARRPAGITRFFRLLKRRRNALVSAGVGAAVALAVGAVFVTYWFLAPGWFDDHVAAARAPLIRGSNNGVYNILFFRFHGWQTSGIAQGAIIEDTETSSRIPDSLRQYELALQLDDSDRSLVLEYQTIKLAHMLKTGNSAHDTLSIVLESDIPLTVDFARSWRPQVRDCPFSDEQLNSAAQLDLRCLGLMSLLLDGANRTVLDAWVRLRLVDEDPLVEQVLGNVYLALNIPELAYPRLLSAFRLSPDNTDLKVYLADAAARCGDCDQAELLLDDVQMDRVMDSFHPVERVRMLCLLKRGDTAGALNMFDENELRENPIAVVQLANHLEYQGDILAALSILTDRGRHTTFAYVQRQKLVMLMEAYWATLSSDAKNELLKATTGEGAAEGSFIDFIRSYQYGIRQMDRFDEPHALSAEARWTQLAHPVSDAEAQGARQELLTIASHFVEE